MKRNFEEYSSVRGCTYVLLCLVVIILAVVVYRTRLLRSEDQILEEFLLTQSPEIQQVDVLILTCGRITPKIIERIKERDTPKRKYMIAFLGAVKARQGIHQLRRLVEDPSETVGIRTDSLRAMGAIDSAVALALAERHLGEGGEFSEICGAYIDSEILPIPSRGFWDAFWFKGHR